MKQSNLFINYPAYFHNVLRMASFSMLLVTTKRSMKMTLQCRLCRAIHYPFLDAHARLSYGQLDIRSRDASLRKDRASEDRVMLTVVICIVYNFFLNYYIITRIDGTLCFYYAATHSFFSEDTDIFT
jgi:hypothetical protein